jgi:ribosomal protein S18 acetylase RimI-like enzyme
MIDYRDSHDVDLDQLAALVRSGGFSYGDDRPRLAQQVAGSRYVISAWDGARLVGFARAISDGVRHAYISTVVVAPDYRGRGIGRQLIARLLEGRDEIAFVLHSRPDVKPFYAKSGFSDAEDMMRRPRAR